MRGNAAIAQALKMEGTEYLFCYPANPLIEAAASAGIKPIMSRTERATVNMADGYSRVTNGRRPGVVVTQSGPGIENAFGGIAQAYADSVPLLALPGQAGRNRVGVPPDFDAVQNYSRITKWADRVNLPARAPPAPRQSPRNKPRAPTAPALPLDTRNRCQSPAPGRRAVAATAPS